nr:iron-containing alcohol dehydrogenase [Syntrophales bacterium]
MRFEFATVGRIIFGRYSLAEVVPFIADHGPRVLFLTGRDGRRAASLKADLETRGCAVMSFSVCGEPTLFRVQDAVKTARDARCDTIVGFGGGSIIDLGKAVAALVTNEGDLLDHMEIIGRGQPLLNPPLPFFAIPTT